MKLIGKVWDSLDSDDRIRLLRCCKTQMSKSLLEFESSLAWDKLWPLRQDELEQLDFSGVLGRDVTP